MQETIQMSIQNLINLDYINPWKWEILKILQVVIINTDKVVKSKCKWHIAHGQTLFITHCDYVVTAPTNDNALSYTVHLNKYDSWPTEPKPSYYEYIQIILTPSVLCP